MNDEISWKRARQGHILKGCSKGYIKDHLLRLEDIREDAKKAKPYDSI